MREIRKKFGSREMEWRAVSSINKLQIFLFAVLTLAMFLHIPFTLEKIYKIYLARLVIALWALITLIIVINLVRLIIYQSRYMRDYPDSFYLDIDLSESNYNMIYNLIRDSDRYEFVEERNVPKFNDMKHYVIEGGSEQFLYLGGEARSNKLLLLIGPVISADDDEIEYLSNAISDIIWDEE